jgi:hypothetical protein
MKRAFAIPAACTSTLLLVTVCLVSFGCVPAGAAEPPNQFSLAPFSPDPKQAEYKYRNRRITVTKGPYHGWKESLVLSNGKVEAIIVPAIGRVMQFLLADDDTGPFWENHLMDGKAPDPNSKDWGNFGGDKTWPSPQADWPKMTPRSWPPPPAFDSMPVDAKVRGTTVTLTSPIDPYYGIRTVRRIELDQAKPVMTIATTFEKVRGDPKNVGVWVITQLSEPKGAFMPVPINSIFKQGYDLQSKEKPPDVKVENNLVSLTRDPATAHKIGNDAGTLIWVGEKLVVRIDCPRLPDGDYPHKGGSAEIYTNPNPLTYVELETHGPRRMMKIGDRISSTNTYTLLRRTESSPEAEARKVLAAR